MSMQLRWSKQDYFAQRWADVVTDVFIRQRAVLDWWMVILMGICHPMIHVIRRVIPC